MSARTLISADALRTALAGPKPPVVIDTGFDLTDPGAGRRAHADAHLPGALYWHLDDDLAGAKTGRNGRHPLPARVAFAVRVGQWGIGPTTPVVIYDSHGAMYAARAWWMLRWLGHEDVAVLDGGLAAWRAAGGPIESGEPKTAPGGAPYPAGATTMPTIGAEALAGQLGRVALVDARAPERYRGDVEPLDAQAGHIPGALNRCFKDNLGADGRFKPAAQLAGEWNALLGAAGADAVVQQCGSGVTACHNLLALAHAGRGDSVLYPGSWSEWSSDPARPVAKG